MKKLLTITFILSAFYCSGQTPYVWPSMNLYRADQQEQVRKNIDYAVKRGIDSAMKTLPNISKENLAAVNALSVTLSALTVRLKGISDTISMLSKNTVDTSSKKAIQDLQKNYDALLSEIDLLTVELEVIKLWYDRNRQKQYIIDFK